MKNIKKIKSFLAKNPLATVSTIDEDNSKPESALVAFAETENLEIVFETFSFSRKHSNLQKNAKVAFVIGWDLVKHITLQYEGVAELVPNEEMECFRRLILAKKTPCTEEYLYHPDMRLYKVKPTWIMYSDYAVTPPKIIELSMRDLKSLCISQQEALTSDGPN